jgi:hypothetical protein
MTFENTDTLETLAEAVDAAEAPAEPTADAVDLPADVHDGTAGDTPGEDDPAINHEAPTEDNA